jgi:hypothetical protein
MPFLLLALLALPCNIHPVYALDPSWSTFKVVRDGSKYRATTQLSFRIREVTPATIVSAETGVLEHVRGHQIIAQRVSRAAGGHLEANGSTAQQARARLTHAVAEVSAEQNRELVREEHAYDAITQNGAEQSQAPAYGLPGGPDVQDPGCTH